MKAAVIGAGSWGTALARILAQKYPQSEINLWVRRPQLAATMCETRMNTSYLPGITLPETLKITSDLSQAVTECDVTVIAVPSHAVRDIIKQIAGYINSAGVIVSATKGIEQTSLKSMSTIIAEEIPAVANRIAILSGPNHAEEVGREYPTATVAAASDKALAEYVQDVFILPYFRVYTNPDLVGVELAGALKNVIALGAGIAEGLGFGDNTKAALITRGLAEITRLGATLGANPLTFAGLAGIGDLVATCTSRHSRNNRAGILLGQGQTRQQIQESTQMVIESFRTTQAAYQLAAVNNVNMPIINAVYQILYEHKAPKEAVLELMARSRTHEVEEMAFGQLSWQ